ncbi:MAG TPA: DMT family transporter [Gemmatimonadaceae bacterium]|nr:DMT family transporter [Gemmatimonadaceae bacterium]
MRPSFISAVLVIAVLGTSTSGPLVRLSDSAPVSIAAWRLILSLAVIAFPLAVGGSWRQWRRLDGRALGLALLAGVMLALHFWSWMTSVHLTTVAASVVLVNTQPLIVAAISVLWLREPPTPRQWAGIAIAVVGAAIVALPDLRGAQASHPRAMLGDMLAVVGAITAAMYYAIGRRLRAQLDLWPYVALVYGACLVALLVIAGLSGVRLAPNPRREYAIFAGLALGPMLLGHTGMNWALRYARSYQVSIVLLGEPIGATLLAAMIPGIRERPGIYTVCGGILVLAGILLAERRTKA